MESMYELGLINMAIPAWQMAFYIGLISFFMISRKTKLCLLTTYLFGLYWGYYLFGGDFLAAASGNTAVATVYICFGLALAAFSLMALFYEGK